ncbi:MAG: adenine phosphoribosyltransferase [Clostridiales bacterium]|jgi:adenine phosphoribosyltransferase|nr:adenine phosphoribosyltransferase [Clostridiales bacterium]
MSLTYKIEIAGLERELQLCKLNDDMCIAAFIMFGDVELTVRCASELLARLPEYDYLIAPEAKAIPLLYEMARQTGSNRYLVARKGRKLYMADPIEVQVRSITTDHVQKLYIGRPEAELMRGKRIVIVDDVVSTGESLNAVQELVKAAGGTVVAKAFVLAEGDAAKMDDIIYLQKLPLFTSDGKPLD